MAKTLFTIITLVILSSATSSKTLTGYEKVEPITGIKGTYFKEEGVHKISWPREEVPVTVEGQKLAPFAGLTSWVSFTSGKNAQSMIMGDLVLFEDEVNSVMTVALDAGLSVTALHNHFFFDNPKVYFMHIGGEGKTEDLAKGIKACIDKTKQIRQIKEPATSFDGLKIPSINSISEKDIIEILGPGEAKDGMFKVVIGRKATMKCGCEVGKNMGVNTWAAFFGSDINTVVDGDFAVLEHELQPVLKSLRKSSINVVAIHNHMVSEQPRMLFVHFWGKGVAKGLAKSIKQALDEQNAAKE